ncbi:MAG TPA: hypothetical protein VD736_09990 [Nitrososphaera sp.]|nr:hypothetical protein [Nitrososphaera sp.]
MVISMILSGARGVLQKIDNERRTITLNRRSGKQDYEYPDSTEPGKWINLVSELVDVQLRDFLVIGVSENLDPALLPARGEA